MMPIYTFSRVTGDTHRNWRGAGCGALQSRIRFRQRTEYRLSEAEMREIILRRIEKDKSGKNLPGRWIVRECDTGHCFGFDIGRHEVGNRWW